MTDTYDSAPRLSQEKSRKIRMWPSRLLVDPWNLDPADVQIEDIAHHLGNINRFTGGTPWGYSVAQHCLLVASHFEDPLLRMVALCHENSEAYLNDPASPVKRNEGMEAVQAAHHRAQAATFVAFDLPYNWMPMIKWADDAVFHEEQATWAGDRPYSRAIIPWQPAAASYFFLLEFERLWVQLGRGARVA